MVQRAAGGDMNVQVTLEQILTLAPSARSSYRDAFSAGQEVLDRYRISQTPLRVAHFIGQVMHESGALTIQFENLNYSPERLPKVWPSRFQPKGPLNPVDYAHNAEKLANEVYGGRMGNTSAGDGFRYRGRGLLQLTGKDSYAEATSILRQSDPAAPDFTLNPDAAIDAAWCLKVAASEWAAKGCNEAADQDLINTVTLRINGGLIGLAERIEWTKRSKFIWL
jgi:putative chitinase